MTPNLLQLATFVGLAAAIPQPGWEQWLSSEYSTTSTRTVSVTTSSQSPTTSLTVEPKWSTGEAESSVSSSKSASITSSSKTCSQWPTSSPASDKVWNSWKPTASQYGSSNWIPGTSSGHGSENEQNYDSSGFQYGAGSNTHSANGHDTHFDSWND
jgi:hypothetical protein